jgi:hypothetical protein
MGCYPTTAGGLTELSRVENRSDRLLTITLGHEIVLFTLQGAIFGVWR